MSFASLPTTPAMEKMAAIGAEHIRARLEDRDAICACRRHELLLLLTRRIEDLEATRIENLLTGLQIGDTVRLGHTGVVKGIVLGFRMGTDEEIGQCLPRTPLVRVQTRIHPAEHTWYRLDEVERVVLPDDPKAQP